MYHKNKSKRTLLRVHLHGPVAWVSPARNLTVHSVPARKGDLDGLLKREIHQSWSHLLANHGVSLTQLLVKPPRRHVGIVPQTALRGQGHGDINGPIHQHWRPIAAEQVDADGRDWGQVVPGAISCKQEGFSITRAEGTYEGLRPLSAPTIHKVRCLLHARDCSKHLAFLKSSLHLCKAGKIHILYVKATGSRRAVVIGAGPRGVGGLSGIQAQVCRLQIHCGALLSKRDLKRKRLIYKVRGQDVQKSLTSTPRQSQPHARVNYLAEPHCETKCFKLETA